MRKALVAALTLLFLFSFAMPASAGSTINIYYAGPEESGIHTALTLAPKGTFNFVTDPSQADVFVLPSRIEASPNAALEAMAAGVPVVASNVGGIPEAIRTDVTGVLVPPNDAVALADALSRLFHDPVRAERLGLAARRHVETHYSFDRMVTAFQVQYVSDLVRRGYTRVASLNPDDLQTVAP